MATNDPTLQSLKERLQTLEEDFIGTIQVFGCDALPKNYLRCDGAEYLKADFPELFGRIGNIFGNTELGYEAPTSIDYFRVPNLLDRFVRNTDGERILATQQEDTMQKITGSFRSYIGDSGNSGASGSLVEGERWNSKVERSGSDDWGRMFHFDSSKVARTSEETRPKNVTLIFAIKAK